MATATVLLAENDQLKAALRIALRLVQGGPLAIACPSCGAKRGQLCYGNGPMAVAHGSRARKAAHDLEEILTEATQINKVQGHERD